MEEGRGGGGDGREEERGGGGRGGEERRGRKEIGTDMWKLYSSGRQEKNATMAAHLFVI